MDALLVADPEETTRELLGRHLERDGFEVLHATAGVEALDLAEQAHPDLVLLGSALEDAPGVEVCTRLRAGEPGRSWNRDVPVIMIGERDPVDCVRAFARGVDDYVARPLVYDELLSRIRAVLRRVSPADRDRLQAGELVVDRRTRDVRVGGRRVALAAKEYELLLKLASEPVRVFTKEQLLREVWGFRSLGRTRTLDSHASRLRRKLAAVSARPWVVNQWGVGTGSSSLTRPALMLTGEGRASAYGPATPTPAWPIEAPGRTPSEARRRGIIVTPVVPSRTVPGQSEAVPFANGAVHAAQDRRTREAGTVSSGPRLRKDIWRHARVGGEGVGVGRRLSAPRARLRPEAMGHG